jgi:hypothetical protein
MTAIGWPAARSRARRAAARLIGAPDEASSTAAGSRGGGSQRRRARNPANPGDPGDPGGTAGYPITGGSADPVMPSVPPAMTGTRDVAASLRSCRARHQYSGAYSATMSRPSR